MDWKSHYKFEPIQNVKEIGEKTDKIETCPFNNLDEIDSKNDDLNEAAPEKEEPQPLFVMGHMYGGLYCIDFTCSNCKKRHEDVILGTEIKCDCGAMYDFELDWA